MGGFTGQASDIAIQAKEIIRIKKTITEILSENTGKDLNTIKESIERDFYMSATEALEFGIIDTIYEKSKNHDIDIKGN